MLADPIVDGISGSSKRYSTETQQSNYTPRSGTNIRTRGKNGTPKWLRCRQSKWRWGRSNSSM